MFSPIARRLTVIALLGVLLLALAGCTQLLGGPPATPEPTASQPGPTATAEAIAEVITETPTPVPATATATPTATTSPTPSPTATETPAPTPTSSPSPSATPVPPTPTVPPTVVPGKTMSVLLLGHRGSGLTGGAYLSDAIQVVVYDQTRKTAVILSIPRDIWVTSAVSGSSTGKINTFMAYGGGKSSKAVISKVLGYPIQSYISVDFSNFRRAIDEVGGIDVNVVRSFETFRAGMQHMNGTRALEYTRIRKSSVAAEGTDFARQTRQRQVIRAFLAKVRTPAGLARLPALLRLAQTGFRTDLSLPSLANLTGLVTGSDGVKFYEFGFTSSGYLRSTTSSGGAYIIVPRSRTGTWSQVRGFVNTLFSNPPLGLAMPSPPVIVVNATGGRWSNSALVDYVEGLGYLVAGVRSGDARDTSAISVRSDDRILGDALKASLDQRGVSASIQSTTSSSPTVIFGRNYK